MPGKRTCQKPGGEHGKLGGFSAGDLQSMQKRRVTAVFGATERIDPPGHNLHSHDSV